MSEPHGQAREAAIEALARELGPVRWVPPDSVIEKVAGARKRKARDGLMLAAAMVGLAAAAAAAVGTGLYAASTILTVLSVLAFVGAFWFIQAARRALPFPVAVFEDGVFVPATFESAPGLETLGPARAMRRSRIKAVEDISTGTSRAIVLRTRTGTGGIVSGRMGDVDLTPDEQAAVLDGFKAALAAIGLAPGPAAEGPEEPAPASP